MPADPYSPARRACLGALLAAPWLARAQDAPDFPWEAVRKGGHVLLIRHAATEPGLGDPKGYKLGDCATQRNLSEAGREQAKALGARLKAERVPVAKVYTSPWCRCRDTAMLAFGQAEDWEALSSFFDGPHREPEFTERVMRRIAGYATRPPAGNVVMVTHNVNIAGLTKLSVATAEVVAVRPDGCCGLKVAGRWGQTPISGERIRVQGK